MKPRPEVHSTILDALEFQSDWPPEDLVGFCCWWQRKLELIPEPARESVRIKITALTGFGKGPVANIHIDYPV